MDSDRKGKPMGKHFEYEWWTVVIRQTVGTNTFEFKSRSKEHAIKQIQRYVDKSHSSENLNQTCLWDRIAEVEEVYWDTLKLDRVGYQRTS